MPLSTGRAGSIRGVPRVGVCFILSRHRFLQSSTPPPQIWIAYPGPISQQFEKILSLEHFPYKGFCPVTPTVTLAGGQGYSENTVARTVIYPMQS